MSNFLIFRLMRYYQNAYNISKFLPQPDNNLNGAFQDTGGEGTAEKEAGQLTLPQG
jgi:hypothetical protein